MTRPGTTGATADGPGLDAPTALACPAAIAEPTSIASDLDASDLGITADAIYFRSGTKLVRVGKDGSGRTEIYTSKDLVRAYTDGTTLVIVESPNPPNAVVRVRPITRPAEGGAQVGTNLIAAGTRFFGGSGDGVYAIGETATGDTVYRVARQDADNLDTVSETKAVVADPQIVGDQLWFVKDQTQVMKLALATPEAEPALVATVEGGCGLAVGATKFFCTRAGAVEERGLGGGSPKKLFDAATSKIPAPYASGVASGEVFVGQSAGEGALKGVVRSIVAGTENVVACGRDAIRGVVTDGSIAVWVEPSKGIFTAKVR